MRIRYCQNRVRRDKGNGKNAMRAFRPSRKNAVRTEYQLSNDYGSGGSFTWQRDAQTRITPTRLYVDEKDTSRQPNLNWFHASSHFGSRDPVFRLRLLQTYVSTTVARYPFTVFTWRNVNSLDPVQLCYSTRGNDTRDTLTREQRKSPDDDDGKVENRFRRDRPCDVPPKGHLLTTYQTSGHDASAGRLDGPLGECAKAGDVTVCTVCSRFRKRAPTQTVLRSFAVSLALLVDPPF